MVKSRTLRLKTSGNCDITDITEQVAKEVDGSGIENGIVTVFAVGSTAGIATIEHESGLVTDFKAMWDKLIPPSVGYHHNQAWGDGNGHSHLAGFAAGAFLDCAVHKQEDAPGHVAADRLR